MNWSTIIIAFALAMDAFAVAVSNGILVKRIKREHLLRFGLYFGLFQGGMTGLGYLLGRSFSDYIQSMDHWIAFALLGVIGLKMFRDTFDTPSEPKYPDAMVSHKTMIILATATSIDALAVGVSYSVLGGGILLPVLTIGVVSLVLSSFGVYLGYRIGRLFEMTAQRIGGALLMLMGLKILVEHISQGV